MKESKLGQLEHLQELILFVIIIAVLAVIIWTVKIHNEEYIPKKICRQSVDMAALSNIRGIDTSADINCPAQYVTVKKSNQESIKKELADKMADCWWQFGEGKKELFGAPKTYCIICSVISFQEKNHEVTGFSRYLTETNLPARDISYMDYFNGFETSKADELLGDMEPGVLAGLNDEKINTSKKYAVLFVYAKSKDEVEKVMNHVLGKTSEGEGGAIAGGIAGVAGGIAAVSVLGFFISNPVGWAVGFGFVVLGTFEYISYRLSSDNNPEWASFVVFREYTSESIQELGCMELPAKQN